MDHREVELKLKLDPEQVNSFVSSGPLANIEPMRERLQATYFDDQKGSLWKHGFQLRIRKEGDKHVQTLKAGEGFERREWEQTIENGEPCLKQLRQTPARKLVEKCLAFKPVFETDVERRTWTLSRNGSKAEVTLDEGVISAGANRDKIAEVEFELMDGHIGALFDLAREFIERSEAPLSFVDKNLRGRRLAAGLAGCTEPDLAVRIDARATAEEALLQVIAACLRQLSVNGEVLRREPESIEGVHQSRVSVRRLRASLSLFRRLLDGDDFRQLKGELKWISDLLGEARDLDVLTTRVLNPARLRHPDIHGMDELNSICEERQAEAHGRLLEALDSVRYRSLLLDLVRFMHAGSWKDDPERKNIRATPFRKFAERELDKRLRKIVAKKNRAKLTGIDELARHRVRIKSKKLRYMAEFAVASSDSNSANRVTTQLKVLQDALGTIHDGVAAEQILSKLLAAHPHDAFAATVVAGTVQAPAACIEVALCAFEKLRSRRSFQL